MAVVLSLIGSDSALAQVVQDPTLGTQVRVSGSTFSITDGTTVGTNLFHSFQEFSIPAGAIADFVNETSVTNILVRVTGGSRSDIFGQIRAQGNANLFLMNPSGIFFGQNSIVAPRLLMNGSFIATTANAILFPNNGEFSLTSSITPQNEPLLKVNPSALLFNQLPQAVATIQSNQTFLRVASGQNLLLVGGEVNLSGGGLTALGGRIDIGAISNGTVELLTDSLNRPHLQVPSDVSRAAVRIDGSAINASGTGSNGNGGSIQITAATIDAVPALSNGTVNPVPPSFRVNGAQGGNGGAIQLNASDRISLAGTRLNSDGSVMGGDAGSIFVDAGNLIEFARGTTLSSQVSSSGVGGTIQVRGGSIRIADEGTSLLTNSFGVGDAGDVFIEATDDVQITGGSTISTVAQAGAIGAGGDINIQAASFTLSQGSQLATSSLGPAEAGDVNIHVQQAGLITNGQILANTAGSGQGGTVRVQAETLTLSQNGRISSTTSGAGDAGDIQIRADELLLQGSNTGVLASTAQGSGGNGGNIILNSEEVLIQNGASIAVNSGGSGTGGDIAMETGTLALRGGFITTETDSTNGGNLNLQVRDWLLLRHQSLISASAGTDRAGGDGGRITIRAPFVVSVLSENNDIRANAYSGRGGTVTINAQGIYGLQFQLQNTPFSDITASSQFGVSGVVILNTPLVDPSRGLTDLPIALIDPSRQIRRDCSPRSAASSGRNRFTVTGRGGLPPSPESALRSEQPLVGWVALEQKSQNDSAGQQRSEAAERDSGSIEVPPSGQTVAGKRSAFSGEPLQEGIVEAQGWTISSDGSVALVAAASTITPASGLQSETGCSPPQ